MGKIRSEKESFDIIILTETHLSKEIGEIQKMEKYLQVFTLQHVHDRSNASGRKGVTIGIRKNIINTEDIVINTDEGQTDEGRWIRVEIKNLLDKPLCIWGIYAPTLAKDRKKWLKDLGNEIRIDKGYTLIAGDFNFVIDTTLDKRGGKKQRNNRNNRTKTMGGRI